MSIDWQLVLNLFLLYCAPYTLARLWSMLGNNFSFWYIFFGVTLSVITNRIAIILWHLLLGLFVFFFVWIFNIVFGAPIELAVERARTIYWVAFAFMTFIEFIDIEVKTKKFISDMERAKRTYSL